jgi:hypothetical protein
MKTTGSLRIFQEAFLSRDQEQVFNAFPNINPSTEARGTLGVCIGFLIGLSLTGEIEKANEYADTLIASLTHCNLSQDMLGHKTDMCDLDRDGTAMGFSFVKYRLVDSLDLSVTEWKDRRLFVNGKEVNVYNKRGKDYIFNYNGGLLFHGLNNQIFAVSLTPTIGWQIHT